MKLPPKSVLKSWPKPNYVNPETRGNSLLVFNSVFLALVTICLVLRLYTRLVVKRWLGWDDFFITCAYIFTVLMNVAVDLGTEKYGWTRHAWDIPIDMAKSALHVAFYAKLSFLFAGFFTAQSLLSFYFRLIQESGVRSFRIVLQCSVVFNLVAWLPFVFTEIFVCVPTYAYWSFPEPAGARCMDEGPVTMVGGLVKIIVDILIATLPIPLIMRMSLQKKQKYLVCLLLGLGYIVCIAGAVRAFYTWKAFYNTDDVIWYQFPAFVASALENNLAIICACIPAIRPLFPHLLGAPVSRIKHWMSSKSSSQQHSHPDPKKSDGSRLSQTRSGFESLQKLNTSTPMNHSASSEEGKMIIRQTESFELNSIHDGAGRPGYVSNPDYFHFGPRVDERNVFHAV